MKKLYLDCDGVILNTINKSYQMIKERGITGSDEVKKFYENLNWESFILEAGEIDNATSKIKDLINTGMFDIKVLTHVNSEYEGMKKTLYFADTLPGVEVISVPKGIKKSDFVNPLGAILVDDYLPNLEYWQEKGGIPIKFSDSGKECKFIKISDLSELISVFDDKKVVRRKK